MEGQKLKTRFNNGGVNIYAYFDFQPIFFPTSFPSHLVNSHLVDALNPMMEDGALRGDRLRVGRGNRSPPGRAGRSAASRSTHAEVEVKVALQVEGVLDHHVAHRGGGGGQSGALVDGVVAVVLLLADVVADAVVLGADEVVGHLLGGRGHDHGLLRGQEGAGHLGGRGRGRGGRRLAEGGGREAGRVMMKDQFSREERLQEKEGVINILCAFGLVKGWIS